MKNVLIADSGSSTTDWCFIGGRKKLRIQTQGISPYFMDGQQIADIIRTELLPALGKKMPTDVFFYGTGCANPDNAKMIGKSIKSIFPGTVVKVESDLIGASKSVCGHDKGIVSILGTGSNSCYYNGKRVVKNSPGLGYVLGDEGSGAYLGKRVIQHFLYQTFDPDLMDRFSAKYKTDITEILETVYKKPLANRYLAGFTGFLIENRGHFMIENIIEDGFNDFFFNHIYKYRESWTLPIHFVGSVAFGFKDVLKELCEAYELQLGKVIKTPMDGLIEFHKKDYK
jgi:N-acetylglucosamine kinase-like BadF-type ATPase